MFVRKPSSVLRRAKHVLETRGWYKGHLYDYKRPINEAPCCVVGAVNVAETGRPDWMTWATPDVRSVALDYLRGALGLSWIGRWNDDPTTVLSDVFAALYRAASLAEKDGK